MAQYIQNPRVTLGLANNKSRPHYIDRVNNQPVADFHDVDGTIFQKIGSAPDASTLSKEELTRFHELLGCEVYVQDMPRLELQYPLHLYHAMLLNTDRMLPYIESLGRLIRPGMVVWELGSGLSVFAMVAAKLGARVYALEPGLSGDIALELIRENGLADRIVMERGLLGTHEPQVKADIVISEFIGDDIFEEEIVRFSSIARERYLKAGGTLLPSRITSHVTGVEHPGLRALALRQQRELEAAAGLLGLKADCLGPVVRRMHATSFVLSDYRWSVSAEREESIPIGTALLQDVDLMEASCVPIHGSFNFSAENDGFLDAWYVHFMASFPGDTKLSTSLFGPAMFSWPEIWIPGPAQRHLVRAGELVSGRWLYRSDFGVRPEASHARGWPRYEIRRDA